MAPPRWRSASRRTVSLVRVCISRNDSPPGNRKPLGWAWMIRHSGFFASRLSEPPVHAPKSHSSRPGSTRTAMPRAFASGAAVSRARSSGDA